MLNFINVTFLFFSGMLIVLIIGPNRFHRFYKFLTLLGVMGIFLYSLDMWLNYAWYSGNFAVLFKIFSGANLNFLFVVDSLSLFFIILTTFIFPFCILAVWEIVTVRVLLFYLILVEFLLILTFTVFDLFLFCLFFEGLLIPMFFVILWWGSRERRIKALTYFFLYTLLGSIFLFLSLFIIYFEVGSTSFFSIYLWLARFTFFEAGMWVANYIWVLFFLAFAIKVPVFPFHLWLPEAHVEAPTVGSVILAGLLLKIGGYGIVRFLWLFSDSFFYWQCLVLVIVLLSIWIASISALRQLDLKKAIAYSSIAHMNFALAGFFSGGLIASVGGFAMLLSHGIVSSALFLLIGFIYDRHHTRNLSYYGGIVQVMPLWVFFFFIFIVSNFSFPGSSNFIGELLIFIGVGDVESSFLLIVLLACSTFLTVAYSLFLFNRISFGSLKTQYFSTFSDLTRREVYLIFPLFCINFIFGLVPNFFLAPIYAAVTGLMFSFSNWDTQYLFEFNHTNNRFLLQSEELFVLQAVEDIVATSIFFYTYPVTVDAINAPSLAFLAKANMDSWNMPARFIFGENEAMASCQIMQEWSMLRGLLYGGMSVYANQDLSKGTSLPKALTIEESAWAFFSDSKEQSYDFLMVPVYLLEKFMARQGREGEFDSRIAAQFLEKFPSQSSRTGLYGLECKLPSTDYESDENFYNSFLYFFHMVYRPYLLAENDILNQIKKQVKEAESSWTLEDALYYQNSVEIDNEFFDRALRQAYPDMV